MAGITVIALVIAYIAQQQGQNRRAIRVSCVLLNNAVIQSSGDPTAPLLIGEIVKLAEEHGHRVFVVKFRELSRHPHPLRPVNCARIAGDPDSVRAIPVHPASRPTSYGGHG